MVLQRSYAPVQGNARARKREWVGWGAGGHVGSVAVDKSVIPLGTRMYIVAGGNVVYGLAVAEDTGVKGNTIDLYYDTYEECIQFGRRNCTVYILE